MCIPLKGYPVRRPLVLLDVSCSISEVSYILNLDVILFINVLRNVKKFKLKKLLKYAFLFNEFGIINCLLLNVNTQSTKIRKLSFNR